MSIAIDNDTLTVVGDSIVLSSGEGIDVKPQRGNPIWLVNDRADAITVDITEVDEENEGNLTISIGHVD